MNDTNLGLLRQIGVADVFSGMPPEQPVPVWDVATLLKHKTKINDAGQEWAGVESLRLSEPIKLAKPGRDEDIPTGLRRCAHWAQPGFR